MFLIFLVIWFVLNGRFSIDVLIAGVAVSAVLALICYQIMGFSLKNIKAFLYKSIALSGYGLYLVKEVFLSTLKMIDIVLNPNAKISPCLIKFKPNLHTKPARILLANSITLTPGTITADLDGEDFWVHTISKDMITDISSNEMTDRIMALEIMPREDK